MTRRHRARWLGPPGLLLAALTLAGVLAGCYGARPSFSLPAARPHESAAPDESAEATDPASPSASGRPGNQPPPATELLGRTWMAEGPDGWEAGQIGGQRIALAAGEIGVATGDSWIISAVLRPTDAITLLIRNGPADDALTVELGSLAPTATVIVGDRAFVSGFSFADSNDPGILSVDLETGAAGTLLEPSGKAGTRYLAVSPDGTRLVSSLCDLTSDVQPERCLLTVVDLADGAARDIGHVPGGLLRATGSRVAVVAPHDPEAPRWLAGVDLDTGAELWRIEGGEFGAFVMTEAGGLIQSRITEGARPRLVIEAVDLGTGAAEILYEEAGTVLRSLWPALSSERQVAIGEDATGSRALAAGGDAQTTVSLIPVAGGEPVDVQVSLRSEQ